MFGSMLFTEAVNTPSCCLCFASEYTVEERWVYDRPVEVFLFCCSTSVSCVIKYPAKPVKSMMASDDGCQVSHKLGVWPGNDCASTATYDAKHWTHIRISVTGFFLVLKRAATDFSSASSSSSHDSGLNSDMSTNSSLCILATTKSGRGSMESPMNIPTAIVGMILGSLLLIRAGKGLVRVMLLLDCTTAGVMAWVFVLVFKTGTKGGGPGWLTIGASRGT